MNIIVFYFVLVKCKTFWHNVEYDWWIPCWGGGGGGVELEDLGRLAPSEAKLQLALRPLMMGVASSQAFLAASGSLNVTYKIIIIIITQIQLIPYMWQWQDTTMHKKKKINKDLPNKHLRIHSPWICQWPYQW